MPGKTDRESKILEDIGYARENSIFYKQHLQYIDKFNDIPFLRYEEMEENAFSLVVDKVENITVKNQYGNFIRYRNSETEKQEEDEWNRIIDTIGKPGKTMIALKNTGNDISSIRNAVENHDGELKVFDRSEPLSKAARIIRNEYIETIIADQYFLLALGQYLAKNGHDFKPNHFLVMEKCRNSGVFRRVLEYFEGDFTGIKYLPECGIILGYGKYRASEYINNSNLLLEIVSPGEANVLNKGEYGLLTVSTMGDSCQPIYRYKTDIFTRMDRGTGNMETEGYLYSDRERILDTIYRFEGVITHRESRDALEIVAMDSVNEYKLSHELRKKNNVKYIIKYVDDFAL